LATKWKNSTEKLFRTLIRERKVSAGILCMAAGIFWFYIMIIYCHYHTTTGTIFLGFLSNFLFSMGVIPLGNYILNKKYENWMPVNEAFYTEWKSTWSRLERRLLLIGIFALLLSCWYLSMLIRTPPWYWTGGSYYNYASGYMAILTVLIQFIICQILLIRFMNGKLNLLMEQMTEINRQSLEKALEIERDSLEKVSRSDQLRVDLITNVSHDLKTPLTSMVGYLELMKKETMSDVAHDYLEVISNKAEKLKEMIESLFSLAKVSSGNTELHMEKFEVNRLIEQLFADMEDRIQESGLHFVKQLTEENTELISDNMYFYRICQNLLENALKYSAKDTRVFIKTDIQKKEEPYPEQFLCMEITNTAGYFMDFKKEDIVERFARGDKERSTEGNGLGLAIVSTYAGALGGEFDIQIDCDQFKARLKFPQTNIA
jgi:signal transduction histidine kinase